MGSREEIVYENYCCYILFLRFELKLIFDSANSCAFSGINLVPVSLSAPDTLKQMDAIAYIPEYCQY